MPNDVKKSSKGLVVDLTGCELHQLPPLPLATHRSAPRYMSGIGLFLILAVALVDPKKDAQICARQTWINIMPKKQHTYIHTLHINIYIY